MTEGIQLYVQVLRARFLYQFRYKDAVFTQAADIMSPEGVRDMVNGALALCGHPLHEKPSGPWPREARIFLALFR